MEYLALKLTKARIGLSTNVRDEYLEYIVQSVIDEIETNHSIKLDKDNFYHLMFVVDFSDWRYSNRDEHKGMPRHLKLRLHNIILKGMTVDE